MANETKDKTLEAIRIELKEHTVREEGRPLALTSEMFMALLGYLQNGLDREESVRAAKLGLTTFYRYMELSETFREAIEHAEDFPNTAAEILLVKAIVGSPPRKVKQLDKHGNLVDVEYPEILGDADIAKWWLERRKKTRFGKDPDIAVPPLLGAPKNEKEAELIGKLLNKAKLYAESTQNKTVK